MSGGRRRGDSPGRGGAVRDDPDDGETAFGGAAGGERAVGTRVAADAEQRDCASFAGGGEGGVLGSADASERHDADVFREAGAGERSGGCEEVPGSAGSGEVGGGAAVSGE